VGIIATFVDLSQYRRKPDTAREMNRVSEDVASGYWTPSLNGSSGLISHYGSTPLSSARLLDRIFALV